MKVILIMKKMVLEMEQENLDEYFDYETMGFGPCCTDYDTFIKKLINLIENDCKNPPKYIERIEKTFKYTDHNNCKRVYEEILKLE